MVARQHHLDDVADMHPVVQQARALAELFAQDGDAVAAPLGRVVPQGIVAPHLFAEPHPDMRARGEARQVAPVRIDELVAVDVERQIGDRANAQLHMSLSPRIAPDAKAKTSAAAPRRPPHPGGRSFTDLTIPHRLIRAQNTSITTDGKFQSKHSDTKISEAPTRFAKGKRQ